MKQIKLYENWIKLKDDYKGTQPAPGSRFHGGDEGEWKFIWNSENNRKDITSDLGLSGNQKVYEVYHPDALLDLIGYEALKNGTELSKNLFSSDYLSDDNVKYPKSESNNRPSTPEWNKRFNFLIKTLIVSDVLVHIDYTHDIRFVSILKEKPSLGKDRYDELGMNSDDKEVTGYSIKKSKPFDRRGKERRFFDEKGKEVMPKNEPFDKKNPTIQGSINDFQINYKSLL